MKNLLVFFSDSFNEMWSYFSRDALAQFQYEFTDEVTYLNDKTLWKVFNGKKKTVPYDKATLFLCELKSLNPERSEQMKACFRSFKTLRHPNLLAFVDGIEAPDKICVATEPVTCLSQYAMDNDLSVEEVTLGLNQVCTALEFIIQRCNMIHNNVNWNSIFVTKSGEWKLGGFEFLMKKDTEIFPSKLPSLQIYDPPEKSRGGLNKRALHATDSWGLGCVLWELFNGPMTKPQSVKNPGKVPKNLQDIFSTLTTTNPASRLSPWLLNEQSLLPGGCMTNVLVKSNMFLDEISIKNTEEKRYFFQSLHEKLDSFPKCYLVHKILPIMLDTVTSNIAFGSIILPSLMKIGESLESFDYESQIVPVVVKLFSSPDRQTRMNLLIKIDCYIEHVKSSTVNNDIYPHIVQGFMDTNPTVREQTVKAMLFVAPKLSNKNLNDDLMRHFARIQAKDEHAGIRTNTTVCIGKLAGYMDPATRQKVLPAASGKAMRDPFPPSRIAGILAILANLKYFTVKDTACRCLPTVSPLTCDPEKPVREQAFKAVNLMVKRLEEAHEKPEKVQEMEIDVNRTVSHSSTNKDYLKSFTGWVLSSWSGNSAISGGESSAGSMGDNRGANPGQAQNGSVVTAGKPREDVKNSKYDKDATGLKPMSSRETSKLSGGLTIGGSQKLENVDIATSGWDDDDDDDDFERMLENEQITSKRNLKSKISSSAPSSQSREMVTSKTTSNAWEEENDWNDGDDEDEDPWEDFEGSSSKPELTPLSTPNKTPFSTPSAFIDNSTTRSNLSTQSSKLASKSNYQQDFTKSKTVESVKLEDTKPTFPVTAIKSKVLLPPKSTALASNKMKPKSEDDFLSQLEKEESKPSFGAPGVSLSNQTNNTDKQSDGGGAWEQWGAW